MKSGADETETGGGDVGGNCGVDLGDDGGRVDMIGDTEDDEVDKDDTGGEDVDIDDETGGGEVGGTDVIDNGGRVDVIGDTEDEDVDVDDEINEDTLTRSWDDSGRETAGVEGGLDCSMSLLFTPSSSTSSNTCWWRLESRPASRMPETSAFALSRAGKAALTAAFLAKYSSLREM